MIGLNAKDLLVFGQGILLPEPGFQLSSLVKQTGSILRTGDKR